MITVIVLMLGIGFLLSSFTIRKTANQVEILMTACPMTT